MKERLVILLRRLRHLSWKKIKAHVRRLFYCETEERIYRMSAADALKLALDPEIHRDRWEDLASFVPAEPGDSLSARLEEWKRRLKDGQHVYTRMENGKLAAFGWMIERQQVSWLAQQKQSVELPPDCAVTYDFYSLPQYRNRNYYPHLLMHTFHDAALVPGTQWIHTGVTAEDKVPRWWVERLGCKYLESYCYRRVLWREKKWRRAAS
jgi:hypothetical protein